MQLIRLLLLGVLLLCSAWVRAEHLPQNPSGEISVRGNYWRDRNTRVVNPTVELNREVTPGGVRVGAHYMLDAITSASIAAGVTADEPFTELRHEVGFNADIPLSRNVRISGTYRYSSESDYWSHNAGLRLKLNLAQDNTALLFGVDYGNNVAAKRLGVTGYLLQGRLDTVHLVGLVSQVFSKTLIGTFSYEVTLSYGYHNNPYRPVFVGGERREIESLPTSRNVHVFASTLNKMFPIGSGGALRHVTLRPGLRIFVNSWGLVAGSPELATSLALGPTELRLLFGYYGQRQASFYRAEGASRRNYVPDTPSYDNGPVMWDGALVYTSDVKLSSYSEGQLEAQFKWRLSFLRGIPRLGPLLDRSILEMTAGMYLSDRAPGWQYGIPLTANDPLGPAGCSRACGSFYANLGYSVPL